MNNTGDAKKLAEFVLAETDWNVNSEVFVQTVEENLVYLTFPTNFGGKVYRIIDQSAPYTSGIIPDEATFTGGEKILAFYSSCRNKPHRFQFIYIPGEDAYGKNTNDELKVKVNASRIIEEKDCQYYIDFSDPETTYVAPGSEDNENGAEDYNLFLPVGFSVYTPASGDTHDSPLSSWYRGARYGFAQ
jgi:hypothetical protein